MIKPTTKDVNLDMPSHVGSVRSDPQPVGSELPSEPALGSMG